MSRAAVLQLALVAAVVSAASLSFAPVYATGAALLVLVLAALLAVGIRAATETYLPGREAVAFGISAAAYLLFVANAVLRDSVFLVVPLPGTVADLVDGLINGWARAFSTDIPVADDPSILLLPPTLTWIAAFVAGTLALRRRAALAPIAPALVLYVVGLVFTGGERWSGLTATLLVATSLALVLLRAEQGAAQLANVAVRARGVQAGRLVVELAEDEASSSPEATDARRRRLAIGAIVGLVVVVLAPLIGPRLPLSDAREPLDPREMVEEHQEDRDDLNPLVIMREQLTQEDPEVVFTARPSFPGASDDEPVVVPNWRLAVLDEFDGVLWSSSARYDPVGTAVPADDDLAVPTRSMVQDVEVERLDGLWLPGADRPTELSGAGGVALQVDASTGTIVTDRDELDGISYQVISELPLRSETDLALARPGTDPEVARFTELPQPVGEQAATVLADIEQKTAEVTSGATRPIDQAIALRDWFLENFDFDPEAQSGHSYGHLHHFLFTSRQGSPEHFATAYAVMARSLGLPARVAVGYVPGQIGEDGEYELVTDQAHAWPELYFEGLGWVPFEPTQSRAADDEASVAEAEALQSAIDQQVAEAGGGEAENRGEAEGDGEDRSGLEQVLLVVAAGVGATFLAFLGCLLFVVVVRGRRRRRRSVGTPRERVVGAYQQALDELSEAGLRGTRAMTAAELVSWTEGFFGVDAAGELRPLGSLANAALFSGAELPPQDADAAWVHVDRLGTAVLSKQGTFRRIRRWTDPRLVVHRT